MALELWQFNCGPTLPSRRGFVRLRADATRVPAVNGSSPSVRNHTLPAPLPSSGNSSPVARKSNPMLPPEHAGSEALKSCGSLSFSRKDSDPHLCLVSAVYESLAVGS